MTYSHHVGALALLRLPASAYGFAVRLRNRFYDLKGAARTPVLPVISVGNLTVGGTGKTPLVAWLVRELTALGRSPAVVSRGYGGTAGRGPLVVSRGDGPEVPAHVSGDETNVLARTLPGCRIVAGADRVEGVRAARDLGADVAVLDDGFQHRRIARDLDIVLVDASNPFGNYRLLPAGILREPLSGLARADCVVITRSRAGESLVVIERVVRRHHPDAIVLRAGHRRVGFVDRAGQMVPPPERALAFCGIGNPTTFVPDCEAEGVQVVATREFRDHHPYTVIEFAELAEAARRAGAALVTTEKDMVRLPDGFERADVPPVVALRIAAEVHSPAPLLDAVRRALGRDRR